MHERPVRPASDLLSWRQAVAGAMFAMGMGSAMAASHVDVLVNQDGLIDGKMAITGLAGGEFTYRAKVKLNGGDDASGVVLTQELPAGAILKSVQADAGIECTLAGGKPIQTNVILDNVNRTIACKMPTLQYGVDFKLIDFNVILPSAGTDWRAVASAALTVEGMVDQDPKNNQNITRNFTVENATDLSVNISASSANVNKDEAFYYDIAVESRGPQDLPSGGHARLEFDIPAGAHITALEPLPAGWACEFQPHSGYPVQSGKLVCRFTGPVVGASYLNPVQLPPIRLNAEATMNGPIGASVSVAAFGSASSNSLPDAQTSNNVDGIIVTAAGEGYVDMSLKKAVSPTVLDMQAPSTLVNYTLTPRREGGSAVPEATVVVTDVLPAAIDVETVEFAANNDTGWNCSLDKPSRTVACEWTGEAGGTYFPYLNHTDMPAIRFSATLLHPAGSTAPISNEAVVKLTNQPEPNTANNKANAVNTFSNVAQLQVTKSGPSTPIKIGQDFAYSVVLTNQGPMDVLSGQKMEVVETPGKGLLLTSAPAGWTCLPGDFPSDSEQTCTSINGLAANQSETLEFGARVDAKLTGETKDYAIFSNAVGAGLPGGERDHVTVSSSSSTTLSNESVTLALRKDVIDNDPIESKHTPPRPLGQQITYRLTVTNTATNPQEIARKIRLEDPLTELVKSTDGIKSGETPVYPLGGFISAVEKSEGTTCSKPTGDENSRERKLTCMVETLPAGESTSVLVTIIPRSPLMDWQGDTPMPKEYANTVTARSLVVNGPEQSSTATVNLMAHTNIDVVKQANPAIAAAGQIVKYTVTVANRGPSRAERVSMEDSLPAKAILVGEPSTSNGSCQYQNAGGDVVAQANGLQGGTFKCTWAEALNVGEQRVVTYFARSPGDSQPGSTLLNTVTVDTATPEMTKLDNQAEAEVQLTRAELDVAVGIQHTADGLALGEETEYIITVSNTGKSVATGISMTDMFPSVMDGEASTAMFEYLGLVSITGEHQEINEVGGFNDYTMISDTYSHGICSEPERGATSGTLSCLIPVLAPGDSVKIRFKMKAKDLPEGANIGTIYHTATVKPIETEYLSNGKDVLDNNSTDDRTSANRFAVDLGIVKSGPATSVFEGDEITYTLTVSNWGSGLRKSPQATVTDALPVGLTFVRASSGCTYEAGAHTVTCTVSPMDRQDKEGEQIHTVFNVTARLTQPYTGERPLKNSARVSVPDDSNPDNDGSTTITTVEPPPKKDFGINKSAPEGPLEPGDPLTYTITVTNHGEAGILYTTGAKMTDRLPKGLKFVSATGGEGCEFTELTRMVVCAVPALDTGGTAVFTIETELEDPYRGARPIKNVARVTLEGDEHRPNDEHEAITKVVPPPDAHAVPTLAQWSLFVLSLLLGWMAWAQFAGARRRS